MHLFYLQCVFILKEKKKYEIDSCSFCCAIITGSNNNIAYLISLLLYAQIIIGSTTN